MNIDFDKLSYTDLIALLKQENTPPGGKYTLDFWAKNSNINNQSILLDLACSTGYSSRYFYNNYDSYAYGIDLSPPSIKCAVNNSILLDATHKLNYSVCDACSLPFKNSFFDAVISGCNFAFIQDRDSALIECSRVLKTNGYLFSSNFFYHTLPEEDVLDAVKTAIGFRPQKEWVYEYWNNLFKKFFILESEEVTKLNPIDEKELYNIIRDYIYKNQNIENLNKKEKQKIFEHFLNIRSILNQQSKFQGVALQVWRKK